MKSPHKDIKVPLLQHARCETGLQADIQAAATPVSPGGRRKGRGRDLGRMCGRLCTSSFFVACSLTFLLHVCQAFTTLSRVNSEKWWLLRDKIT